MENEKKNELTAESAAMPAAPAAVPPQPQELDQNMIIASTITEPDVKFYDVREAPFRLYGFYQPLELPEFTRIPAEVGDATSAKVARLGRESVGGRVRFATDSEYVAIRAEMPVISRNSHTPLEASAGFDLYEDYPEFGESRFIKSLLPQYAMQGGYEQLQRVGPKKLRYFTVHFPVHSRVKNLQIGIQENAVLRDGLHYRDEEHPIVIYGSSIVHGTGATRPGTVYSNILCRRLNRNVLNYGFSGNAKAEDAMTDWLATLPMSVFVCDYDHNAPNVEYLQDTHYHMYERFRALRPDVPYIVISRPNMATNPNSALERRNVILDTFHRARANGDRNIWYIDGETFFLGKNENDCTIDAVHPNDMGYAYMCDGIEATIREIFSEMY